MNSFVKSCLMLVFITITAGCGSDHAYDPNAPLPDTFSIILDDNNKLKINQFDVYLTDMAEYPETLKFHGPDGSLHATLKSPRVGYGVNWQALSGRSITVSSESQWGNEPSVITINGVAQPVLFGIIRINQLPEYDGEEISGTISLTVGEDLGSATKLRGQFTAVARTWG